MLRWAPLQQGRVCSAQKLYPRWRVQSPDQPPSSGPGLLFERWKHYSSAVKGGGTSSVVSDVVENIEERELHVEATESYVSYAMSVIVGRALPDVRDGLKPVHRRILYAMYEERLLHTSKYRKCANVVGLVLGRYHPHGDKAVYDAMVRLAQWWNMREPLIDGHGNFGSLDPDNAAAMRYTECRMRPLASTTLLDDLDCDTVEFGPNYDASTVEPTVLPAKFPHLLVNGAHGIAVGIATKIPPHNLVEVVEGLRALIADPNITNKALMEFIPAPDFPTGGELLSGPGLLETYEGNRGSFRLRAKVNIEVVSDDDLVSGKRKKKSGRAAQNGTSGSISPRSNERHLLVITELPYQVGKTEILETIAEMVNEKQLDGADDIRDESDRQGLRVVVEVKKGMAPQVVLNQLFKHTRLQINFSCNMVAIVGGLPTSLTLKDFLHHFLEFRCDVVTRRTQYRVNEATKRLHMVEGYIKAVDRVDEVVQLIRSMPDRKGAVGPLMTQLGLTKEQAEGVLDLTLSRLTGLEKSKFEKERDNLMNTISELRPILESRTELLKVVEREAVEVARTYGNPRRTVILTDQEEAMVEEDVVDNQPQFIIYSRRGYIKRVPIDTFEAQKRGGKGKSGGKLRENDALEEVVHVMTHDQVLFLTSTGRCLSVRAHKVPEASRTAMGTAIAQVLPLNKDEKVAAMLPLTDFNEDEFLLMLTRKGFIKKTPLKFFKNIQKRGIVAAVFEEDDILGWAGICDVQCSVMVASSSGNVMHCRTDDKQLRPRARQTRGLKVMRIEKGHHVVGMSILPASIAPPATQPDDEAEEQKGEEDQDDSPLDMAASSSASLTDEADDADEVVVSTSGDEKTVVLLTAKGMGKRVRVKDFPCYARGSKGVIGMKLKPGDTLTSLQIVDSTDDLLLATREGQVIRCTVKGVPQMRRAAQGVKVMSLEKGDEVQAVTVIPNT